MKKKERYLLIDGIRGISIVSMVIFHFLFDVNMIYGRNPDWYGKPQIHFWQQCICWTFILVSGFVWSWGKKSNLRRGIFLNVCGLVVTIVTCIATPNDAVWFGILNFMGCAVLLLIPLQKTLQKITPVSGIVGSFLCFILFRNVQNGVLGIGNLMQISVPAFLYKIKILTPFGFPFSDFVSSDYFPILPWIFMYLAGYFANIIFVNMKQDYLKKLACRPLPVFTAIGQKSIWIYMVHQPLCMLVCMLLFS